MNRHLVNRHMGDEVRCRGNIHIAFIAIVIFAIGFDDLRHVTLALVGVVTGVWVRRIADGVAGYILWNSDGGKRSAVRIIVMIDDLELIAQNPLQDRKRGKFRRRLFYAVALPNGSDRHRSANFVYGSNPVLLPSSPERPNLVKADIVCGMSVVEGTVEVNLKRWNFRFVARRRPKPIRKAVPER